MDKWIITKEILAKYEFLFHGTDLKI